MSPLLTTLTAVLLQLPQEAPSPSPSAGGAVEVALDVLALKNGDELVGRITAELDGYVEIEVEDGATIGVSRAMVKAVRRAARSASSRAAVVRPEDTWFVLHDADGASVGWLHASVTTRQDGSFSVNEEYEFVNGVRRYQVTIRCTAAASGSGVRCYFRERVSTPRVTRQLAVADPLASADRVEDERIVEAVARGDVLEVSRLDGGGRSQRCLPWSADATFPLLARALARQSGACIGPATMFDPRHEQLSVQRVDGSGVRRLRINGVRQRVGEVSVTAADGATVQSREWLDASSRVVRRELAGPALVAVPSSAAGARAAVGVGSIESAVVAEAEGRFGLWIPSPAWRAAAALPAGHLALDCDVYAADVRLSLLDHLEPGTQLETAADAVGSWFSLLHPELAVHARYAATVRGRPAVRMEASDARNTARATLDVMPFGERFLVLICRAPAAAWEELAQDFAFVRRTLELDRAALSPEPTGPLRERRGGRMRPPAGPLPAPTPARRVESVGGDGSVRIPR
ncbi:MAG: hypothetical protein ACON4Z_15070 [Planctomycetota bacterium]